MKMKRIFTLCVALCSAAVSFAQTDSTGKQTYDTIRIGGMIIVRKPGHNSGRGASDTSEYRIRRRKSEEPSNISTNWWIFDIGFSNYSDKSNYTTALSSGFVGTGVGKDQMKLRTGASRNVNVWFFMQKLNMASHVLNLKYGLGLELNNYFFDDNIVFTKKPTKISLSATDIKKAKLAADYLTVPVMLNFNFTPRRDDGFGFSAGISGGFLYSSRYKMKEDGDVKRVKNNFDLEKFKLSYIGELSLGPVRFYGSVAMKNMWEKGLDMTPYNFGFRFSNW
jgi:hypothetical protein